jgi:hypothetical protein
MNANAGASVGKGWISFMRGSVKITTICCAPVSQAYNPSYSGGRDQEDNGSKSAWANNSQDPISKIPIT